MNELVRWDPFKAVAPFEDGLFAIPSLLRPFASRMASSGPRMDIVETAEAYELSVETPGVPKDAIQVSVHDNSVTIAAEMPEREEKDGEYLLRERSFGRFTRTVTLPEAVDDEASAARYVDGVLTLTLKKKNVTQAKRIAIH
ncbi:MAG TPA: Hsp20/alpha crystallin family protein [Burkholderiales bacterium]|nr:Hsp20/alpha crystallin family protein [Burkholderiales bacterium]